MGKIYPAAKVVLNNETLLDVTETTATPTEIAKGFKIISATGAEIEGTLKTQLYIAKIYATDIADPLEGFEPDWYTSITAAQEDLLNQADKLLLRDGDFLVTHTYYNHEIIEENVNLVGDYGRSTYVYINAEDEASWIAIGTSAECDSNTMQNLNGKISLKLPDATIGLDDEYIPYLDKDKKLQWKNSSTLLDDIDKIETFFADVNKNAILDGLDALNTRLNSLQTEDENLNKVVPLTYWGVLPLVNVSLQGLLTDADKKYSNTITQKTYFNRTPIAGEQFTLFAITKDNYPIVCRAKIGDPVENDVGNIIFEIPDIPNSVQVYGVGAKGNGVNAEVFNGLNPSAAIGDCSHAEGKQTTASGSAAHSEGTDTTASGNVSHAEGYTTTADGNYSHAEGSRTFAYGEDSHAEGSSTNKIDSTEVDLTDDSSILNKWATEKFSLAKGPGSHIEGKDNLTFGNRSHAEGKENIAMGNYSHAEGQKTQALELNAHAEGGETKAEGQSSHAEGVATVAKGHASHAEGYFAEASGEFTHAEGGHTKALGDCSHAEGAHAYAYGWASHAEGNAGKSYGEASHTEGQKPCAFGKGSHSEGLETTAVGYYSHAEGSGECTDIQITNIDKTAKQITFTYDPSVDSKYIDVNHIVTVVWQKIEDDPTIPEICFSHARIIERDLGNGTIKYAEIRDKSKTDEGMYTFEDLSYKLEAIKDNIIVQKIHTGAALMHSAHSEGRSTVAGGDQSHAEGYQTIAMGNYSHAEGNETKAEGQSSHAEGAGTTATGIYSHTEGCMTAASGESAHAEGDCTTAEGTYAHAEGVSNKASGLASHTEGGGTRAIGTAAHAEGANTTALGEYSHSEGSSSYLPETIDGIDLKDNRNIKIKWITDSKFSLAKGRASHIEGEDNLALGDCSHAEGYQTLAEGEQSHAEGNNTIVLEACQHVQGKYNISQTGCAHVVGNGNSDNNRSNAHTLDWQGNAWFAGDVYVGGTCGTNKDTDSKRLATEEQVQTIASTLRSLQDTITALEKQLNYAIFEPNLNSYGNYIVAHGETTLERMVKPNSANYYWGWASGYEKNYEYIGDTVSGGYFYVPEGWEMTITVINQDWTDEKGTTNFGFRPKDGSSQYAYDLYSANSFYSITLSAGYYVPYMANGNEGYDNEYDYPDPSNIQIDIKYSLI